MKEMRMRRRGPCAIGAAALAVGLGIDRARALEGIVAETQSSGSAAFFELILERRNRLWLPRLRAAFDEGDAFVAVGLVHTPGEAGLLEMLRAEGYTFRRVE